MIGYHCKLSVGERMELSPFFLPFEVNWYVLIGWMDSATQCLRGGLI